MALWPAGIMLLDFRKCGLDQRRKRKHLIILSKDSSLEFCKCESSIFKGESGLSENAEHPLLWRSGPTKAAGSSLQTDPLIFSACEALSSQTEPNRPTHCQVVSAQGTGWRGVSPSRGPLRGHGSRGRTPPTEVPPGVLPHPSPRGQAAGQRLLLRLQTSKAVRWGDGKKE